VSGPITDGIGRFVSATGFLRWDDVVDPVTLTLSDTIRHSE
jgi:hypothetical protein